MYLRKGDLFKAERLDFNDEPEIELICIATCDISTADRYVLAKVIMGSSFEPAGQNRIFDVRGWNWRMTKI